MGAVTVAMLVMLTAPCHKIKAFDHAQFPAQLQFNMLWQFHNLHYHVHLSVCWLLQFGLNKQAMHVATQYASATCKLTISSYLFARWHLFQHVGYLRHRQQVDLWPFDLESGVRVTCEVGYLCANITFPSPLCSRVRHDVCNRQRDVRQKHRLMPSPYGGRGVINRSVTVSLTASSWLHHCDLNDKQSNVH